MKQPIFKSVLADELAEYLALKRALGYAYRSVGFFLRSLDRYVSAHAPRRGPLPLDRLVHAWLTDGRPRAPRTLDRRLSAVRMFFEFRKSRGGGGYVPDRNLTHARTQFVPHVLSKADVRALLKAAKALAGPPERALAFHTLILILYCTGLRHGEAVRLQLEDVDLRRRVLNVRESKGRTRFVPFGSDLGQELGRYLRKRPAPQANQRAFLLRPDGCGYATSTTWWTLRQLFQRVGLKPGDKHASGRVGPRPTDFRHTFAVHRLTRWYRAGVDLHVRLPLLSAYMGHNDLLSTQVYLTATPELLAGASRRFERRLRQSRRQA